MLLAEEDLAALGDEVERVVTHRWVGAGWGAGCGVRVWGGGWGATVDVAGWVGFPHEYSYAACLY